MRKPVHFPEYCALFDVTQYNDYQETFMNMETFNCKCAAFYNATQYNVTQHNRSQHNATQQTQHNGTQKQYNRVQHSTTELTSTQENRKSKPHIYMLNKPVEVTKHRARHQKLQGKNRAKTLWVYLSVVRGF